jgi:hypothetical protein
MLFNVACDPVLEGRISLMRGVFGRILLNLLIGALAWGQESRSTIQGRVLDPSGAAIPGVSVAAVNLATNVATRTTTVADGSHSIPLLLPGVYRLEAIELRVNERLALDLQLQLGETKESVTVAAETPLLAVATANLGQVIDARRVAELPNRDGNPFSLVFLSPGVVYTYPGGSGIQAQQFLQNAITNSNINGTPRGSTERASATPRATL